MRLAVRLYRSIPVRPFRCQQRLPRLQMLLVLSSTLVPFQSAIEHAPRTPTDPPLHQPKRPHASLDRFAIKSTQFKSQCAVRLKHAKDSVNAWVSDFETRVFGRICTDLWVTNPSVCFLLVVWYRGSYQPSVRRKGQLRRHSTGGQHSDGVYRPIPPIL